MYDGFSAPNTIHLITHEPNDVFVLIIVHSGEWDGSRQVEDALLVKLNDYLNFVLNGEFHMRYPQAIGKEVRVRSTPGLTRLWRSPILSSRRMRSLWNVISVFRSIC